MLRAVLSVVLLGVVLTGVARANALKTCIAQVAEVDASNKRVFHSRMRDLIVREAPQFEELAGMYRDHQLALVDKRLRQLQYLLFTNPQQLSADETVSKLTNYDWNELDTARMAKVAPEYKALTERIAGLEARNNAHPDWPKLREFVAKDLSANTEFEALKAKLWTGRDAASAQLKSCRGG
ncbi:MAG: hypothetical protein HKN11_03840 [Rhizobiales bacterium]|nr:hypothetical protein [Hyphomicrobiales bacterium]